MKLPAQAAPVLWGAAGGAAVLAFVGFNWAGWVSGGAADKASRLRSDDAVVAAMAPVCVERFERGSNALAARAALQKTDAWSQGDFVEKGGWAATQPAERVGAVAKACALLLTQAPPVPSGPGVRP